MRLSNLLGIVAHCREFCVEESTRETYATPLRAYVSFLASFELPWVWGPPPLLDLVRCLFAAWLGLVRTPRTSTVDGRLSMGTIRSYLAGVNFFIKLRGPWGSNGPHPGFPFPSTLWTGVSTFLAKRCRAPGSTTSVIPLTSIVCRRVIGRLLQKFRAGDETVRIFVAALVAGVFFSWRTGELSWGVPGTTSWKRRPWLEGRDMALRDVSFNDEDMRLVPHSEVAQRVDKIDWVIMRLPQSKRRHGPGNAVTKARSRSGHVFFCPLKVMASHVVLAKSLGREDKSPLFWEPGDRGRPLQRDTFTKLLRQFLREAGVNPDGYTGYSMRKAMPTCLMGASEGLSIMGMGTTISEVMLAHRGADPRLVHIYAKVGASALRRLSMAFAFSDVRGFELPDGSRETSGLLVTNPPPKRHRPK